MNSGPQDNAISLCTLLSGHWDISATASPVLRTHFPVVREGVHNMPQWHKEYLELQIFQNQHFTGEEFSELPFSA